MSARLITGAIAIAIGLTGCTTGGAPTNRANTDAPTTTSVAAVPIPQLSDLQVNVIVTGKQCFDPSNCVYHYAIDPFPTATFPPQPSGRKFIVIYTVTGGNQSQIGNYTIDYTGDADHQGVVYRDTDATVIGPDNAVLVATPTQIVAEGVS